MWTTDGGIVEGEPGGRKHPLCLSWGVFCACVCACVRARTGSRRRARLCVSTRLPPPRLQSRQCPTPASAACCPSHRALRCLLVGSRRLLQPGPATGTPRLQRRSCQSQVQPQGTCVRVVVVVVVQVSCVSIVLSVTCRLGGARGGVVCSGVLCGGVLCGGVLCGGVCAVAC